MTRINSNVPASIAQANLARSQDALQVSLQRLSTGLRINVGKDDPAGLIASEVLRSDITSIERAITNSERANQVIATADSALGQVSSLLNDIRGLVSEAANTGALSQEQVEANQLQVDSSLEAIDRIARTTTFQGRKLLDGSLDFTTTSPGKLTTAASAAIVGAAAAVTAGGGQIVVSAANAAATISVTDANNDIAITALSAGTAANDYTFTITSAAGSGVDVTVAGTAVSISYSGAVSADTIIQALSAHAGFSAVFAASAGEAAATGLITANDAPAAVTTGGGVDFGEINLSSLAGGTSGNATISLTAGTTNSVALTGGNLLVTVSSGGTLSEIAQLISADGNFAATVSGSGSSVLTTASGTAAVTGGIDASRIELTAVSGGTSPNAYAISIAATTGAASAALSGNSFEIQASAAATASEVAQAVSASGIFTAAISGSGSTVVSAGATVEAATGGAVGDSNLSDLRIDQANFGTASSIAVQIQIDTQATQGQLTYSGGTLSSALTLEVGGKNGFEVFNFGAQNTVSQIASAINLVSDATGVSASVSGSDLVFNSSAYGQNSFVSVRTLSGSFDTYDGTGTATDRNIGADVNLRVNGIAAKGDGLNAVINTATLDLSFKVNENLAAGSTVNFDITGGGANFQLGPEVVSNQQARLGVQGVNTATLGGVSGKLIDLRTGGSKSLQSDVKGAAAIVDQVNTKVTSLRGRLGAFQKTTLETNIFTLTDTLQALTDAQSSIRDADFAKETAALTRAQILVQSGTSVLTIANQNPQQVLALLR